MSLIDFIVKLDSNTEAILSIIDPCTEQELLFKQGDAWNVIEIVDHLCITERLLLIRLQQASDDIHSEAYFFGESKISQIMVQQRSHKIVAPERVNPNVLHQSSSIIRSKFAKQRQQIKEAFVNGRIKQDNRIFNHPILGPMTVSDWLWFLIAHAERHRFQMLDCLSAPKPM